MGNGAARQPGTEESSKLGQRSEEARQQAEAEGLTLVKNKAGYENTTGYFGVSTPKSHAGQPKPYHARVTRGGKRVGLGFFATAEEAALCVARLPEGQAK